MPSYPDCLKISISSLVILIILFLSTSIIESIISFLVKETLVWLILLISFFITSEELKLTINWLKPNITTRGFILVNENEELIKEIELTSSKILNKYLRTKEPINQIKPRLRENDRIHLVSCGEFEDLLPKNLIIKTIDFYICIL